MKSRLLPAPKYSDFPKNLQGGLHLVTTKKFS